MRVAFVGKGGSGKSAIAGTFARLLAREDAPVLVLDSDPMPGLAFTLGVDASDLGVPDEAVEDGPEGGPRFRLRDGLTPGELIERYAAQAPDGVRLLQLGKLRGRVSEIARPQFAYQQVLDARVGTGATATPASVGGGAPAGVDDGGLGRWNLVGDLPGGTRQPFFGWGRFAETYLVVVEPTAKSLLAARRLGHLATGWSHGRDFRVAAVASKAREPGDADWIAEHTGLEVLATVPWDEQLDAAERAGRAPLDHSPDAPAVTSVASLLERLREEAG